MGILAGMACGLFDGIGHLRSNVVLDPVRGVVLVVLGISEIVEVGLVQPVSTDVMHPAILSKIGQGKAVTLAPQRSRTEKPPGNRSITGSWSVVTAGATTPRSRQSRS